MSIRKKLCLNCILLITLGLLSVATIVGFSHRIAREEREIDAAEEIIHAILDLNSALDEFLLTREAYPSRQWEAKHEELGRLVSAPDFRDVEELRLLASVRKNHREAGENFRGLSRSILSREPGDSPVQREELEGELRAKLISLSREMADGAFQVVKRGRAEVHEYQVEGFVVLLGLLVFAGGAATAVSMTLAQSILRPIDNLRSGTRIVAEGNLDHRLDGEGEDELGQLTAAFNTMTDRLRTSLTAIENLEQAESRIKRLNRQLKRKVAELREVNREIESFSYSVSHDLRAPLRGIHGFSRILMEEHSAELSGEGSRLVSVIIANTRKMAELIDGLLGLSRLGRKKLRRAGIDMKAMAGEVFAEVAASVPERNLELRLGDLPAAHGDPALIRQVWSNYIANAVKFTAGKEPGTIEIGADPGEEALHYFVRDNGAGFDPERADRLFGLFQRLHGAAYEGTGIGLALVQRIVRRHGGEVEAQGRPGEGATFSFSLPVAARRRKGAPPKAARKKKEQQ